MSFYKQHIGFLHPFLFIFLNTVCFTSCVSRLEYDEKKRITVKRTYVWLLNKERKAEFYDYNDTCALIKKTVSKSKRTYHYFYHCNGDRLDSALHVEYKTDKKIRKILFYRYDSSGKEAERQERDPGKVTF